MKTKRDVKFILIEPGPSGQLCLYRPMAEKYLTITQAAHRVGRTRPTIYDWLRRKQLVGENIAGITFVEEKQLRKLAKSKKKPKNGRRKTV